MAIKKIANAFDNLVDAKRTLREIKLVRHLNHENVVQIRDLIPPLVHRCVTCCCLVGKLSVFSSSDPGEGKSLNCTKFAPQSFCPPGPMSPNEQICVVRKFELFPREGSGNKAQVYVLGRGVKENARLGSAFDSRRVKLMKVKI